MAWKLIGILESRTGSITVLPDWAVGEPNEFPDAMSATRARDMMMQLVPKKTLLRYEVIAAIDPGLHAALGNIGATQPQQPAPMQQPPWLPGGAHPPQ
jgi:hypothetical protein